MEKNLYTINVSVIPNSKLEKIVSYGDQVLKIKLMSLPVKGQANKALLKFLSKKLKVSVKNISVLSGEQSRKKRVCIIGFDEEKFRDFLKKEGV